MRLIDADALIDDIKNRLWDWESVNGITATTVLKQTIADIENQPTVGGWVSVKDRLPEAGVKCLIRDMKDAAIGMYRENGIWQWADGDFYAKGGITHWMPIPEPPEEVPNGNEH